MRYSKYILFTTAVLMLSFGELIAQERITARGSSSFRKVGVHRGNQVRTVFSNYGVIAQPGSQGPRGAWKYDDNGYVGDVSPVVGVRLPIKDWNNNGIADAGDTIVSVVITPVERPGGGDFAQGGKFLGFEPISGFANPTLQATGKGVAMSHQPETWPLVWPDRPTWTYSGKPVVVNGVDVTPSVDWNGYFGRSQLNADQESYFWMDDFNDEKMYNRHGYYPDMADTSRRGQALQVAVRGLQWSNFLAQDVVFWLYNIKNDGTEAYDQTVFGTVIGTYVGIDGSEWNDDASFFDVREAITYTWDFEGRVRPSDNPKWQPNPSKVGYIAYAFLESPGNPYDGVDNDADNRKLFPLSAPYFNALDYNPKTISAGDKLILIDKTTFARSSFTMPNDTATVISMGVSFFIQPGITTLNEGAINNQGELAKDATDGIDNDLDGLIDENYIVHYRQFKKANNGTVLFDTTNPVQYKDYIASLGLNDKMLDEKRDDLIDNDNDWTAQYDDVGADGQAGTGDAGEGDGVPTSGEPNFDALDVDESDQLGLTSFWYYVPSNVIIMSNEDDMWKNLKPGFFKVPESVINNVATKGEDGDFMYGSGYFPLLPGQTERFSLALAFGDDFRAVFKTKRIAQTIYNANYNFPRPPEKPTITAVPGDGKVTLYWDRIAENSLDPSLKERDFEGYKVYKGTDPDFSDALQISDGTGQKVFYKPVAQFDLKNNIYGYFLSGPGLYDLTSGAPFYLGNETGVSNSYVDVDVINGKTYYYAVVAYDRGKAESEVFPSENTRFVAKDALGNIQTDINTAAVTPNAPVLGYVPPASGIPLSRVGGFSTSVPYFEVIDPFKLSKTTYVVTFEDSIRGGIRTAYAYSVKDSLSGLPILSSINRVFPSNGDIFNGVRISFDTSYQSPDSIRMNTAATGWRINNPISDTTRRLGFTASRYEDPPPRNIYGIKPPIDLAFVFSDTYADSSNDLRALFGRTIAKKTAINFKIFDVTDKANPVQVKFVMTETALSKKDTLSDGDAVVVATKEGDKIGWRFVFLDTLAYVPKGGDTLIVSFFKPLTASDRFSFNSDIPGYSAGSAEEQMERVKAVPNPYVVTNVFEQPLPTQIRGRGDRIINFINLPPKSKIHIYTSAGAHVRSIDHDGDLLDGSLSWDLRTKEGLDVAYGVYFYIVEADGVSTKKYGKLAIIK